MEEIVKMAHYITDPCELSCEIGWWIVGKHNIGGDTCKQDERKEYNTEKCIHSILNICNIFKLNL